MKKILFPTDFSKNADQALKYSIGLCKNLKAELVLFHACRADAFALQTQPEDISEEGILFESMERLKNYKASHIDPSDHIAIEEKVVYGLAVDKIVETAEEMYADMIIMGTKGSSGLEEVLLGSNTAAVMERAKCPVLAIPEKSEFTEIKRVAFATDFRENDIQAISYLTAIASLFNAHLTIVHVADLLVPDSYEKALLDVFHEEVSSKVFYKQIAFEIIKGTNPTRTLNEFIRERSIDLVAVSTRKKNLFTRLFDKSFTRQLAYHSEIPVMAFHPASVE